MTQQRWFVAPDGDSLTQTTWYWNGHRGYYTTVERGSGLQPRYYGSSFTPNSILAAQYREIPDPFTCDPDLRLPEGM